MLCLSRYEGEKVYLGIPPGFTGRIEVVVLDVGRGGKVRLGIEAPREVLIMRAELDPQQAVEDRHDH